MIYTVTFNPSLDYIVSVDNFTCGIVNRTTDEIIFPGGKGINVSMVLKNLGFENTALGFLAGFTGNRIQDLLEEKGVRADFISSVAHAAIFIDGCGVNSVTRLFFNRNAFPGQHTFIN